MTSYSLKRAHFHWLFALALLLIPAAAPAKNLDSLLNVLDKCLLEHDIYEKPKNEKAQQLKDLATKTKDKAKALNAWVELSYLEQTRHSDEAITACENGYALARQLGDLPTAASLVLRKALVLGMSGLPWEAKTLLETAYSDQKLRPYLRERNYYLMYYNNFEFYNAYSLPTSLLNRNANIMKHLEDSIRSQQTDAAQLAMTFNYSSYKVTDMIAALKQRLYEVGEEDKGVVANTIANKYHLINNVPRRDYYWAKAAIYNVRCGRRENEALIRLAARMAEIGDWRRATLYAREATKDAAVFNSRTRMLELYPTLVDISQHNEQVAEKRRKWACWGNTVACIIIVVLSYLCIRARRRHRRLMQQTSAMRKQLSDMRTAVADKNDNAMHFLQLALESVLKFEQIKQLVQIKLESGENERLKKMMKDPALLDNFKEKCLRRFDVAFLRLYPSFIKEVNTLLREDAQLVLSETEFMNNDLRLLAFLRIGITDSAQIAAILGVSVNTVYCYRTKLRNRAIDRNNFEKQIAEKDA